jgi:hypothetical protein
MHSEQDNITKGTEKDFNIIRGRRAIAEFMDIPYNTLDRLMRLPGFPVKTLPDSKVCYTTARALNEWVKDYYKLDGQADQESEADGQIKS